MGLHQAGTKMSIHRPSEMVPGYTVPPLPSIFLGYGEGQYNQVPIRYIGLCSYCFTALTRLTVNF
jgi:hypothetical protein